MSPDLSRAMGAGNTGRAVTQPRGANLPATDEPTLLLTRPAAASRRFADRCTALLGREIPVAISPILEIAALPLDGPLPEGTLIFTSENAVGALAGQAGLAGRSALAVGDATAAAARAEGMAVDSAGGSVDDLVRLIAAQAPSPRRFVYLRGRRVAGDLAGALRSQGHRVDERIVYDQAAQPLSAPARALFDADRTLVVPVFSPRSARLLAEELPETVAARLHLIAISAAAAESWTGPAAEVTLARRPDAAAMAAEVLRFFDPTRVVAGEGGG